MTRHDHVLIFNGVWEGIPTFILECEHPDDQFHTDDEGKVWDDCLIQSWWDEEGLDLIQAADNGSREDSHRWDNHQALKLWTHWRNQEYPELLGANEHNYELEVSDVRKSDTQHVWVEAGEEA